jgi:hypothetical protein
MYEQLKVLEMKRKLKEWDFTFHPSIPYENAFVPAGDTDEARRKSTLAFVKKLNSLNPTFDAVQEKQFKVFTAFSEFECVYKLMFTSVAFNYLAKQYALLDYQLQEFNKTVKSYKNVPELTEYFARYQSLLEMKVWDVMVEDFTYFEKVTQSRVEEFKIKDPDFSMPYTPNVDWDAVKEIYKSTLKSAKENK